MEARHMAYWEFRACEGFTQTVGIPENLLQIWNGDSIVHWEGDTVVVDGLTISPGSRGTWHRQTKAHLMERIWQIAHKGETEVNRGGTRLETTYLGVSLQSLLPTRYQNGDPCMCQGYRLAEAVASWNSFKGDNHGTKFIAFGAGIVSNLDAECSRAQARTNKHAGLHIGRRSC